MNDITRLRELLFNTLEGLQDKEHPLDIDRAKATASVAQTLINAAKVEVDYIEATGATTASQFFDKYERQETTGVGVKTITSVHGGSITTHKLR